MNWNPYKRIAELEAMHTKNTAVLDTLADKLTDLSVKHNALGKWMVTLEDRLQEMGKRLNPYAAAPMRSEGAPVFTKAEVADAAEQKRIKQREYSKAHYAKKKARAKQNEYQRAYRARKKAAAQAVGGTA
jgi:uncharacterized coiled-coil protein SlyX